MRAIVEAMVSLCHIHPGQRVLVAHFGHGELVGEMFNPHNSEWSMTDDGVMVAIDPDQNNVAQLMRRFETIGILQGDLLSCMPCCPGWEFDRILLTPPIDRDYLYVKHALDMLSDGGRCVALHSDGPIQRAQLQHKAKEWLVAGPLLFGTSMAISIYDRGSVDLVPSKLIAPDPELSLDAAFDSWGKE